MPTFRVDLLREVDLIEEVGRHYGFDRLEAVLRSHAESGARALLDALLAAVAAHTGSLPAEDDRTVVILTLE